MSTSPFVIFNGFPRPTGLGHRSQMGKGLNSGPSPIHYALCMEGRTLSLGWDLITKNSGTSKIIKECFTKMKSLFLPLDGCFIIYNAGSLIVLFLPRCPVGIRGKVKTNKICQWFPWQYPQSGGIPKRIGPWFGLMWALLLGTPCSSHVTLHINPDHKENGLMLVCNYS